MDLGIKGKVALVAASSMGLGKAVALKLSEEGAKVAVCARGEEKLLQTKDEIVSHTGGEVAAFVVDVTNKDQVHNMVRQIQEELGSVEILVCNAGGPPAGTAEDFSLDDYRQALELNLLSTINLCQEVIPFMKKQKWGRIVNIVSISAKQPIDSLILSNTTRAGVLGFSKTLSNHVAPYRITLNSVLPGYTQTERIESLALSFQESGKGTTDDFYTKIEANVPLGRLGKPEELANAVAFLASEGAGYITGIALQVDGGYVKGLF